MDNDSHNAFAHTLCHWHKCFNANKTAGKDMGNVDPYQTKAQHIKV